MGKTPQSLKTIKIIVENHIKKYGIFCPMCGYKGIIDIDKKDNRPYAIAMQIEDRKSYSTRFEFDHIKPRAKGGNDNIENFQLLCPHCNRSKGIKDAQRSCVKKTKRVH